MQEQHITNILKAIDMQLERKKSCVIAIDGMCGSGKSTLASLLAKRYDCNVFHMDDYFLPMEKKTKERLLEPGGNVDYERFKEEVLEGLLKQQSICFRPYNCAKGCLEEPILVEQKKLTIVEGSYSLHPTLFDRYDIKIFMSVDTEVQLERILQRNGAVKLQRFIHEWIPLENYYFDRENIRKRCDIQVDTTNKHIIC